MEKLKFYRERGIKDFENYGLTWAGRCCCLVAVVVDGESPNVETAAWKWTTQQGLLTNSNFTKLHAATAIGRDERNRIYKTIGGGRSDGGCVDVGAELDLCVTRTFD